MTEMAASVRVGPLLAAAASAGGHEPYPAVVVDGAWEMIAANHAVELLTEGVAPELLESPLNVLRVSLHPEGVTPRIVNLPLRLRTDAGELAFISTVATFGTAVEVTASELSIESFFPADRRTAEALRSSE